MPSTYARHQARGSPCRLRRGKSTSGIANVQALKPLPKPTYPARVSVSGDSVVASNPVNNFNGPNKRFYAALMKAKLGRLMGHEH